MNLKIASTIFFLSIISFIKIFAQEEIPLSADRPDQTESATLVLKKHFQAETGLLFESGGDEQTFFHPSMLLKYGAHENVELRLIFQSLTLRNKISDASISGVDPLQVGMKVKLFSEKKARPEAALLGHLGIPWAGSKEFRPEYFFFNFRFLFEHTLTDWLALGYNGGIEWNGETAEPTFIYTLTLPFSITENFGFFVETFGFIPQKNETEHFLDGGFTYHIKPNLMIDLSAGYGYYSNEVDYFVGTGFSFRLPN